MKFDDYQQIVKTPENNVEFLRHVVSVIDGLGAEGAEGSRKLHTALRDGVEVGGAPFSQARHLVALEKASGDWEHDEVAPAVLQETLALSQRIHDFDPGYNVPHFTVGYEWMKELAGEAEASPSR